MKHALTISGIDAHYLLFAVDHYCAVNRNGTVTIAPYGTLEEWQKIRDLLFAAHEHPDDED